MKLSLMISSDRLVSNPRLEYLRPYGVSVRLYVYDGPSFALLRYVKLQPEVDNGNSREVEENRCRYNEIHIRKRSRIVSIEPRRMDYICSTPRHFVRLECYIVT